MNCAPYLQVKKIGGESLPLRQGGEGKAEPGKHENGHTKMELGQLSGAGLGTAPAFRQLTLCYR